MVVETLQECGLAETLAPGLFENSHAYPLEIYIVRTQLVIEHSPKHTKHEWYHEHGKGNTHSVNRKGFHMMSLREKYRLGICYNLEQGRTWSELETSQKRLVNFEVSLII